MNGSEKKNPKKKELQALTTLGPSSLAKKDILKAYLDEIRRYPLLSREEEFELAKKYYETKDHEAAQKLITSNLRFVVKIAKEYTKFGAKLIELIQEGNVGLMQALKEFNPHKDVKLITYAVWWIRGYIQEYLMKQESIVKLGTTNNQRKLYYKLNKEKENIIREGLEPSVKLLSARLGVREKDVKIMEKRLDNPDVSLDQPLGEDSQSVLLDLQKDNYHRILEDNIDLKENLEHLSEVLNELKDKLNEREEKILKERILSDKPKTLNELGQEWGITREAVRQAEERLMKKIRAAFTSLR